MTYSDGSKVTISTTETEIKTAYFSGSILTSPTVYLHYKSIWTEGPYVKLQHDYNSGPISRNLTAFYDQDCSDSADGKAYRDIILPIPTNVTLSTLYYGEGQRLVTQFGLTRLQHGKDATIQSLNYADLPPNLVPIFEWRRECSSWRFNSINDVNCATIFDDAYSPRLFPPELLRNLDPAWESCDFPPPGLGLDTYDPPFALGLQSSLVIPTMSPLPTPDPAQPGQHIDNLPSRTVRTIFNPPTATKELDSPFETHALNPPLQQTNGGPQEGNNILDPGSGNGRAHQWNGDGSAKGNTGHGGNTNGKDIEDLSHDGFNIIDFEKLVSDSGSDQVDLPISPADGNRGSPGLVDNSSSNPSVDGENLVAGNLTSSSTTGPIFSASASRNVDMDLSILYWHVWLLVLWCFL